MTRTHVPFTEIGNPVPAPTVRASVQRGIRSPGKAIDPPARSAMEARFGHDFSRVRVHSDAESDTSARALDARAFTFGSDIVFKAGAYRPGTREGRSLLAHELTHVAQQSRPGATPAIARAGEGDTESPDPQEHEAKSMEKAVDEDDSTETAGTANCPLTARFSSTVVGQQKANCQVPQGQYGAATLAHFVLSPTPTADVTVTEQFTSLDDPYGLFGLLTPNSYTTSGGSFDDCYQLFSKNPLPPDFSLKVEQNHLLNGKILSKNHITYTPNRVRVCAFTRKPQSCDFGARCR
jgi:hypothetical protein